MSVSVGKAKRNGAATLSSSSADAQVTTINVQGVPQSYFDGNVLTLDETYAAATGGTIDNVNIGATTRAPASFTTLSYKTPVQLITATANTVGTVTLAKTGTLFVVNPQGDSATYMLTLPSTNSTTSGLFTGETYYFSTASGSTLAIRTPFATDATIAFGAGVNARITSPASSGSTVCLVGSGRVWYISSMHAPAGQDGRVTDWTPGAAA